MRLRPTRCSIALVVAGLIGYPLVELVRVAVTGTGTGGVASTWASLGSGQILEAIEHTVVVSVISSLVAVALGVVMALLVERSDLALRRFFGIVWVAPLIIPAYVTGLAWLDSYAQGGLIYTWLHFQFREITGPIGLVVLLSVQGYPLAYLLVRSVLANQKVAELEEAARSAGCRPLRVLREISLPLIAPAILGALLLVFVSTASDFGIPAIVAIPAGFSMVTTVIYGDLSFAGGVNALTSASVLSTVLGVMALLVILAMNRVPRPSSSGTRHAARADRNRPLIELGRLRPVVGILSGAFVIVTVVLPLLALFLESVGNGFVLSIWPGHWTAAQYANALSGANFAALGRSALLAAIAAAAVSVGGALIAIASRHGGRLMNALNAFVALPFALPGSVVAVAVLLAWQSNLYGTLSIILLAYVARFLVLGVRSSDAALVGMSEDLLDAGRASGARPLRVLFDVIRPAVLPGVLTSFALVFLLGIHELTMSSLLYGPSTHTFAVQVLEAEQAGELGLTAALAMVVMAITVLVGGAILFSRKGRRMLNLSGEVKGTT